VRRRENARRGYVEVKTPLIYDKALWVTSGHWEKFRDNMFLIPLDDDQVYGIKPMNCPGAHAPLRERAPELPELPLRYAEAAPLHRNELAGALHGLTRVRYVTQDDAHIFCTREQIEDELDGSIDYMRYLYGLFGLEPRAEFSTRPDDKLGSDEEWDFAEGVIQAALDRNEIPYVVGEGEGSFYGPKIDLQVSDVLGRSWQLGTIQLDRQMPARFGLTYMGPDNTEHEVYVVHRALFGSLERFIGDPDRALRGRVPFWLAPVQVRVVPSGSTTARPRTRSPSGSAPTASRSTTPTRPSASGFATPRSRRSRSPSSTATRSRTRASRSARAGAARRPCRFRNSRRNLLPWSPGKQGGTVSHLLTIGLGGSTNGLTRASAAACQWLFHFRRRTKRAW
jgi:hypothetical protein